jgi:hypothetical protein
MPIGSAIARLRSPSFTVHTGARTMAPRMWKPFCDVHSALLDCGEWIHESNQHSNYHYNKIL